MIANTLIDGAEIGVHGVATTHVKVRGCIIDHNTSVGILIGNGASNFGGNWEIGENYIAMTGALGSAAIQCSNAISNSQNAGNRITANHLVVYSGATCPRGINVSGAEAKNNIISQNTVRGFSTYDIDLVGLNNVVTDNVCLSSVPAGNIYSESFQLIANNIGIVQYARAVTYFYLGKIKISYDEAVPTVGTWAVGDIVWKVNPVVAGAASSQYVVQGWRRLTAGATNVLNTDWVEMRMLTGT